VAYSAALSGTGGVVPYTWSIGSGSLPSGLSLTASSGVISGTTSQAGSYSFTAAVTDAVGNRATKSYAISMAAAVPSYYVSSVNGNDSWSGMLASPNSANTDGPYRSLAKAQSAMQGSSIKSTYVRAGTYTLNTNWAFTSSDNNESWQGYPSETAVIDGAGAYYIQLGANGAQFRHLTFQHLGVDSSYTAGIGGYGWSGVTFDHDVFQNMNAQVIGCSYCQNDTFTNNTFRNLTEPANYTGGDMFAISLWYGPSGNLIQHNLFQNLDGGAVGLDRSSPSDPAVQNNVIDRNKILNVCLNVQGPAGDSDDSAAIYYYDYQNPNPDAGNRITNNWIQNVDPNHWSTGQTKSIYLDDGASNVTVSGNICQKCGSAALQIHGGMNNIVTNNIFDISSQTNLLVLYQQSGYFTSTMAGNTFQHNLIYTSGSAPGTTWSASSGVTYPATSYNLYFAAGGGNWPNPSGGISDTNPVSANPLFTNPAAFDYSMPNTSPAYTSAGFQALPTDQGPVD